MWYNLAFVGAQSLDLVTRIMLPPGGEKNPLAAMYPVETVVIKGVLILSIPFIHKFGRYRNSVLLCGIAAGTLGFLSNLAVIA